MTEAAFRARQRQDASDDGVTPVYADALYDGWRDDALAAISRASPFATSASLAVTAGTKTYALPADWITSQSLELDAVGYPIYRLEDAAGGSQFLDTDFTVYGRTLTLASAPTANATWTNRYGGTWLITVLPNDWVSMALDFSSARAFDRRAADAASNFSFTVGPDSIDRTAEARRWQELRDERIARFATAKAAISTRGSSVGVFDWSRA